MRCGRAQGFMAAAADGELAPRRRHALDRHVASCPPCRAELTSTERLLAAFESLPSETAVSERLEQATLRRVRIAAAEEAERAEARRWTRWLPLPAFAIATAAVLVMAVGIFTRSEVPVPPLGEVARKPAEDRVAARTDVPAAPAQTARAETPRRIEPVPAEPPPDLAEAPEKFVNLPILRNLEKLEHFDAIQTTTLDDEPATPGKEQPSNG